MKSKQTINESETKFVIDSLELLKNDLKSFPLGFFKEYDLQARLYYHLCNNFKIKYPNVFYQIHMEYNPHFDYNKEKYTQNWRNCLENYGAIDLSGLKNVAKKGTYDIVILDEDNRTLRHVIELKKITSVTTEPHKGYEDLYVLSDLLDEFKGCKSYFFIWAVCNSRYRASFDEMKNHIYNIKKTYENTKKVYFDYYIFDKATNLVNLINQRRYEIF